MLIKIVFFGSTTDSVIVLEKLSSPSICQFVNLSICCIVTQPPRPVGRKQILTPTPVEEWAKGTFLRPFVANRSVKKVSNDLRIRPKAQNIPVLSFPSSSSHPSLFSDEQTVIDALQPFKADLLISASFGQRIPMETIQAAPFGGLNVHPSLLPRWRGADPVPWAIMTGDAQTGVTIVTLSKNFDAGAIIAQKKVAITEKDFADPLRTRLFELGTQLLAGVLPNFLASKGVAFKESPDHKEPYARRLTRDDGFEPWEALQKALEDPEEAQRIDRKFRALTPWPGLWTTIATQARPATQVHSKTKDKRLKILSLHVSPIPYHLSLDTVQLEGKKPVPFAQFKNAYLR